MKEKTRLAYSKLWRGILIQDEQMIKDASADMGIDLYKLFVEIAAE